MKFLHRLFTCAALCGSVACSENGIDFESAAPEPQLRTVVIGCAGIDITTRTEIDKNGLDVRWVSGDSIRLWARRSLADGGAASGFALENIPFVFDYYSPQFKQAAFTGHRVDMSGFDSDRRYDYFAVSPTPVSVAGTSATFDIPAVQSGEFNSGCDIMTAKRLNAAALEEGDTNWSIRLPFEHHVHVLKITIPQNALGEKISAVELIFPRPVVGQITVDVTGEVADDFSDLDRNRLTIEFPKGKEKDAGDTFFAVIAPISFASDEQMSMRIIGTTGEASADYTFVRPTSFAAEHLTPMMLHVPAMDTYYTVVKFGVVDNDRPECVGKANLLGVNTLGERVKIVRLVGDPGTFANVVRMSNGCSVSDDGSVLTYAMPIDAAFDGVCEMMFVSRKDAGSKCPWEKWDSNALSGRTLGVEYESERALIKSQEGWKPIQVQAPMIRDGEINMFPALSVPYLFEEDFSKANGLDYSDEKNSAEFADTYFNSFGWTGAKVVGATGYVEIGHKIHYTKGFGSATYERYYGRLDSPDLLNYVKESANVHVSFEYGDLQSDKSDYECRLCYATTSAMDVINPYYHVTSDNNAENNVAAYSIDLPADGTEERDFDGCVKPMRMSWQMTVSGSHDGGWAGWGDINFSVKIKKVCVSLR